VVVGRHLKFFPKAHNNIIPNSMTQILIRKLIGKRGLRLKDISTGKERKK